MIYLDNAATTFPKPRSVVRAVSKCINTYCANAGRSVHRLAIKSGEKIYETREAISHFIGLDKSENVVFTENATYALNIAIKSTVKSGEHILISDIEHNSVLRPVHALKERLGIEYSVFSSFGDIERNIESLLRKNTKCIVSTLESNVIGREISLAKLSKIAKKHSLSLIVDASQFIGHKEINLSETPCSILCAPGHKSLFGIQGVGFLAICDNIERESIFQGGSGSLSFNKDMPDYLPEKFEPGTLPTPSIVSLLEGIKFIERTGLPKIEERINYLTEECIERIRSINKTVLYESQNGIVCFNLSGLDANRVSEELDKYGICTRSGFHCAPLAHQLIGTAGIGSVRISLSYFNSVSELDKLYKSLRCISSII